MVTKIHSVLTMVSVGSDGSPLTNSMPAGRWGAVVSSAFIASEGPKVVRVRHVNYFVFVSKIKIFVSGQTLIKIS